MTRKPDDYDGPGEPVEGDIADRDSLQRGLAGADAAYYLVHSLSHDDFEQKDAEGARNFAAAAGEAGSNGSSTSAASVATTRTCRPTCGPDARWSGCWPPDRFR